MEKKKSILSAISEIISQLQEQAEEGAMTEAEHSWKQLQTDFDQLSDRLALRLQALKVNSSDLLFSNVSAVKMLFQSPNFNCDAVAGVV